MLTLLALPCVPAMALADTPAALAMETPFSPAFSQCISLSVGVTIAMRNCSAQEYARLDRKLNATWRSTMSRIPNEAARFRLRQIQREWIKTRWAECDKQVAQSGGGTADLLIDDDCQLRVIAQRISWLETYRPETTGASTAP